MGPDLTQETSDWYDTQLRACLSDMFGRMADEARDLATLPTCLGRSVGVASSLAITLVMLLTLPHGLLLSTTFPVVSPPLLPSLHLTSLHHLSPLLFASVPLSLVVPLPSQLYLTTSTASSCLTQSPLAPLFLG